MNAVLNLSVERAQTVVRAILGTPVTPMVNVFLHALTHVLHLDLIAEHRLSVEPAQTAAHAVVVQHV